MRLAHNWLAYIDANGLIMREAHNKRFESMAKLSKLVKETARICGLSEASCQEVSRQLRAAKLIRTGKGGRYGGADMSPAEAATLLTALMINSGSTGSIKKIAEETRVYLRDLKAFNGRHDVHLATWNKKLGVNQLCGLGKGHSFGEALTALIRSISIGEFKAAVEEWIQSRPVGVGPSFSMVVEVRVKPFREAWIEFESPAFGSLSLLYIPRRDAKFVKLIGPPDWSSVNNTDPDLRASGSIREPVLKAIGELLSDDEEQAS